MKSILRKSSFWLLFLITGLSISCNQHTGTGESAMISAAVSTTAINKLASSSKKTLAPNFKKYWYAGDAEITSYQLEQARYGEIRDGKAVLVYVSEPFNSEKQVKADRNNSENIPVIKLNATKKFLTGIYPYSIMSSTFYPVYDDRHAIKVSASIQEWCGQVFSQLNNKEEFEITSHSYFESEGDQQMTLSKSVLENELWIKIRVNPEGLPIGTTEVIPSFEYLRLSHKQLKAYQAELSLETGASYNTYTINYPKLKRSLSINFTKTFPYTIEGWTETSVSGYGSNSKTLTSTATRISTLKTPYWRQNGNEDVSLRNALGL